MDFSPLSLSLSRPPCICSAKWDKDGSPAGRPCAAPPATGGGCLARGSLLRPHNGGWGVCVGGGQGGEGGSFLENPTFLTLFSLSLSLVVLRAVRKATRRLFERAAACWRLTWLLPFHRSRRHFFDKKKNKNKSKKKKG